MAQRDESGIDPVAAFACLGNETRLSILRELYEAVRNTDGPGQRPVPYSELQESTGVADSGKFNYHLTELRDQFVSKVDGGYVLEQTGTTVVKIVLRSFAVDEVSFEPTETDADCPRCGGTVAVSYADEHVTTQCLDCSGVVASPHFSDGTISTLVFPPAGVADRPREELLSVVHQRYELHCAAMASGQCPTCGGVIDHEFVTCEDHDADGLCRNCGLTTSVVSSLSCQYCGHARLSPVAFTQTDSPVVTAALDAAGANGDAWDRFAEIVTWPCSVFDGADGRRVRIDLPECSRQFVVDSNLDVFLASDVDSVEGGSGSERLFEQATTSGRSS